MTSFFSLSLMCRQFSQVSCTLNGSLLISIISRKFFNMAGVNDHFSCLRCRRDFPSQSAAIHHMAFCPFQLPEAERNMRMAVHMNNVQILGLQPQINRLKYICNKCLMSFDNVWLKRTHEASCQGVR